MGCGEDIIVPAKDATKYTDTIIRVLVGAPETDVAPKEHHLHAFHLTHRSRFFRTALNRDWKEAVEKTVKFPEDDPALFELYISLIFFGTVPIGDKIDNTWKEKAKMDQEAAVHARYQKLFPLFLLCDRLQDRAAKNTIIDAVVEQSLAFYLVEPPADSNASASDSEEDDDEDENIPPELTQVYPEAEEVNLIYENTTASSSMRRVLVDMWAHNSKDLAGWMAIGEEKFNKTFLFDLVKRIGELSPLDPNKHGWCPCHIQSMCYHEEEKDDEKGTTGKKPAIGSDGRDGGDNGNAETDAHT